MKMTALATIAVGLVFAIAALLCFFAQKRVLEYFLQGNIRQLEFIKSHPWILALIGGLFAILGIWGMVKRASYSGPTWGLVLMVLVGVSMVLGHRFLAQYQYDWYCRFYIQNTGGNTSWRPFVPWSTYAAGVVLGLLSFVSVSTGVYNLRH